MLPAVKPPEAWFTPVSAHVIGNAVKVSSLLPNVAVKEVNPSMWVSWAKAAAGKVAIATETVARASDIALLLMFYLSLQSGRGCGAVAPDVILGADRMSG